MELILNTRSYISQNATGYYLFRNTGHLNRNLLEFVEKRYISAMYRYYHYYHLNHYFK